MTLITYALPHNSLTHIHTHTHTYIHIHTTHTHTPELPTPGLLQQQMLCTQIVVLRSYKVYGRVNWLRPAVLGKRQTISNQLKTAVIYVCIVHARTYINSFSQSRSTRFNQLILAHNQIRLLTIHIHMYVYVYVHCALPFGIIATHLPHFLVYFCFNPCYCDHCGVVCVVANDITVIVVVTCIVL